MNKVERMTSYLIDEVGMKQHPELSRIPISVVFKWIVMFAERNEHLRLTRTWYDPSDEWNTLLGVCEDCLPKKDPALTVCEEPELSMCFNCNEMEDYDREVVGDRYGEIVHRSVKADTIVDMINRQWIHGNGFIEEILKSQDWKDVQKLKSAARRQFCVLIDEEYGYATHLWWPDLLDAKEVRTWYKRQGYIQIDDLRQWGKVQTVDNLYDDILGSMGLPKMHVHEEDDQYFVVPSDKYYVIP